MTPWWIAFWLAGPADTLPITGLPPANIAPDLCSLSYRVSTRSAECQQHFDQGLAYFYSYVWMEAARSFETAARHDPDCAMAWWGLSRAMQEWKKTPPEKDEALKKAEALLPRADERERKLITARLQDRGLLLKEKSQEQRKEAAARTLDELLALHDDDQEAWFARARLNNADGSAGGWSRAGRIGEIPYYIALLRINPLHPGANHELVHIYEGIQRPALGWKYAEAYLKSSPGIPHAWHMQAHLATRLGRWDQTVDRSIQAIELQRAYHRFMNVDPKDDDQFSHHLEILTYSLVHDGRFREARQIQAEARSHGYKHWLAWFRLYEGEQDWTAALDLAEECRKSDKSLGSYLAAIVYLHQGRTDRAVAELDVLREARPSQSGDKKWRPRLWELLGVFMCQSGSIDEGLKLLERAVEVTKDDYDHHAWGNGAYYMEVWGRAALEADRLDVAEEAFLEALAHDPASVRAAFGLEAVCARMGRTDEAARYARWPVALGDTPRSAILTPSAMRTAAKRPSNPL